MHLRDVLRPSVLIPPYISPRYRCSLGPLLHPPPNFFGHQSPEVYRQRPWHWGAHLKNQLSAPRTSIPFWGHGGRQWKKSSVRLSFRAAGLPTLGREAGRWGMVGFIGQPWLTQASRTSHKRSEDPLCCLKKCWAEMASLVSGGEASTGSEWTHRLAAWSGGLLTFFFPTSQSLFAGALGRATEVSGSQATKVLHYWILLNLLHPSLFTPAASRRMTRPCHVQLALCLVRHSKAYLGRWPGSTE